jgi:methionyl-tRNA formyltransferase
VNLHPSLLPAYRGPAPIIWAVIDGQTRTGITTFLLNPRVDAGDILLQRPVAIGPDETAGELEARLAELGAGLMRETVDGLGTGTLRPQPQDSGQATRAPKLTREDGRIDWNQPARAIRDRIRGTNPMPGAFTEWQDAPLKIHRASLVASDQRAEPGTVLVADPRQGLVVATRDAALRLDEVQPAGRKSIEGKAFVRGYPIPPGTRLGAAD